MVKSINKKYILIFLFVLIFVGILSTLYIDNKTENIALVNETKSLTNKSNESLNSLNLNNISMVDEANKTIITQNNTNTNDSLIDIKNQNQSLNQS